MAIKYIKDIIDGKSATITGTIEQLGEIGTTNRNDGTNGRVRSGTISDETGDLKIVLWDDDVELFGENNYVKLENWYVTEYNGTMQISRGKFGQYAIIGVPASAAGTQTTIDSPQQAAQVNENATGANSEPPKTNGLRDFTQEPHILNACNFAGVALTKYFEKLKEFGCESPDGMSAVWNTAMMEYWKRNK